MHCRTPDSAQNQIALRSLQQHVLTDVYAVHCMQENVRNTFNLMCQRGVVKAGDLVVVVTDLRPAGGDIIRSVQVRHVR